MCARYVFYSGKSFGDDFGVVAVPDISPRYNIAPTQTVPGVVLGQNGREFAWFRWGLVPSWAKDISIGQKLINARSETLSEKPSFRHAFKRNRCLIPADGFFEWKTEQGAKQPYLITIDTHPFAFAGLHEFWEGPDGAFQSCTIVTTSANEALSTFHDRMPVILSREEYDLWLDLDTPPEALKVLMDSYDSARTKLQRVHKAVGNPRFDDPKNVEPISLGTLFD